jgi:hypothetical protein
MVAIFIAFFFIDDPATEDRLASLRKLAGLDSKNSLFALPISTQTDATEFLNK